MMEDDRTDPDDVPPPGDVDTPVAALAEEVPAAE